MLVTRCGETVPRLEASEAFRAAHNRAEDNRPLYLDHPQYEGFEVRQTVGHGKTAEWHEYKL
jgi:heme-degrading monooxygenase HmoA